MNADDSRQFLQRYLAAVAADFDGALEKYVADESLKEHGRFFQDAFPGYRIEPLPTIAEDNKIAVHAMFHGVHNGPLNGIAPTGKEVHEPFTIIYYVIEDDQIVDHYFVSDRLNILQQIGDFPTPAPAG